MVLTCSSFKAGTPDLAWLLLFRKLAPEHRASFTAAGVTAVAISAGCMNCPVPAWLLGGSRNCMLRCEPLCSCLPAAEGRSRWNCSGVLQLRFCLVSCTCGGRPLPLSLGSTRLLHVWSCDGTWPSCVSRDSAAKAALLCCSACWECSTLLALMLQGMTAQNNRISHVTSKLQALSVHIPAEVSTAAACAVCMCEAC